MTIEEAKEIVEDLAYFTTLDDEKESALIEALEYLIDETKDTKWMVALGGHYYDQKNFDLALKYYEMADSFGDKWAPEGLGYIWYYGRTGEKDYEKAFKYYSKASENGMLKSSLKLADMYKNGMYVEKDMEEYKKIVEHLYDSTDKCMHAPEMLPEVYTRLARIREEEGNKEEAIALLENARPELVYRLRAVGFFGDLNIMKWLIKDLYRLKEFDRSDFDLYDLFYVLSEPNKVSFKYGDITKYFNDSEMDDTKDHFVESVQEEGGLSIRFVSPGKEEKWFRTIDDFFKGARIEEHRITEIADDLYDFKQE